MRNKTPKWRNEKNIHEYLQCLANGGRQQVVGGISFKHIAQVPTAEITHAPLSRGVHTGCAACRDGTSPVVHVVGYGVRE